ncbi:AAA family ATPase [Saccharopolyspora dendranthemae]|uniref:AAA domain-containing protein n=1 Tax=Saccharopolyspora dendranthemae TaxID=1181886 RepID=A0A561U769_9PSEU|nr:AAA family ATPase [Saccharopolyspora dendranthemae]TWF95209.1 AAA domain-containing protein [Saccharopolyspora dendranthemae]
MKTGTEDTRLVVLRGPSGAGKSSVARELRERLGRGVALVEQDYLRRILLRERDRPGAANIELISRTTRFALDQGYHVILEGIMAASRYGEMLARLEDDHAGLSFYYYLDVGWLETLRRHATRPQSAEFGADEMRSWFDDADRLGTVAERRITQRSTLNETAERIRREAF